MKIIYLLMVMFVCGFANEKNSSISDKNLKKNIEQEKQFAKEQQFYQADQYDFKGSQVDPKIVDEIPDLPDDFEFDMDDVYD